MGKPKRNLLATAEETLTPPASLEAGQVIAKIVKGEGNNLWAVEVPVDSRTLLVELPARFRSTIWLKRGGFVVVDTAAFDDRENKLGGEIVNVVRDEKHWRKQAYWYASCPKLVERCMLNFCRPKEYIKKPSYREESDEEESNVGKMPPSDHSDGES